MFTSYVVGGFMYFGIIWHDFERVMNVLYLKISNNTRNTKTQNILHKISWKLQGIIFMDEIISEYHIRCHCKKINGKSKFTVIQYYIKLWTDQNKINI